MEKIKVGYQSNEWLAVYQDANGERQLKPFNTYEEASEFLSRCYWKIGVVATSWYSHYIEKIIEE